MSTSEWSCSKGNWVEGSVRNLGRCPGTGDTGLGVICIHTAFKAKRGQDINKGVTPQREAQRPDPEAFQHFQTIPLIFNQTAGIHQLQVHFSPLFPFFPLHPTKLPPLDFSSPSATSATSFDLKDLGSPPSPCLATFLLSFPQASSTFTSFPKPALLLTPSQRSRSKLHQLS